jgi:hypothetical protein
VGGGRRPISSIMRWHGSGKGGKLFLYEPNIWKIHIDLNGQLLLLHLLSVVDGDGDGEGE